MADPRFRRMNVRTAVVWTVAFAVCDALSILVRGAAGTWLPLLVLALAVVVSRVSGRRFLNSTMQAADARTASVG